MPSEVATCNRAHIHAWSTVIRSKYQGYSTVLLSFSRWLASHQINYRHSGANFLVFLTHKLNTFIIVRARKVEDRLYDMLIYGLNADT